MQAQIVSHTIEVTYAILTLNRTCVQLPSTHRVCWASNDNICDIILSNSDRQVGVLSVTVR